MRPPKLPFSLPTLTGHLARLFARLSAGGAQAVRFGRAQFGRITLPRRVGWGAMAWRWQMPRRLSSWLVSVLAFVAAGLLSMLIAWGLAVLVEYLSKSAVEERLAAQEIDWVEVQTDGLQVILTGTAPSEAARFRAVNRAGRAVDSGRVIDQIEVAATKSIEAPRFSLEMLRNDDGIQLIGLLPDEASETVLTSAAAGLGQNGVSAMLETASFPVPEAWPAAFDFGLAALKLLPRSKISVSADGVTVTAIAESEAQKRQFETQLAGLRPASPPVSIDISAPRPVLTPFTLRFVIDASGARFDACSADTERARDRILRAAYEAGLEGRPSCVIGLGVPSPRWAEAVEAGIRALAALRGGTITFADADVALQAAEGTSQADFDRVVGDLESALPAVFSLKADLPKPPDAPVAGPAEFTADLAQSGRVELRGRLTDVTERDIVTAFAKAMFGADDVYLGTRLDEELPNGWPVRVLAGLEALAQVAHGKLVVRPDMVEVTGVTGSQASRSRISQILTAKLGQGQPFKVNVTYDRELDPLAAQPKPEECLADVQQLLRYKKIEFNPGSADIGASAIGLVGSIAEVLAQCPAMALEIAGYTDSQGSEEGNRALSQARAEAVLVALQVRRVDVSRMKAVGYGESRPIADNETEEGREANRRIEFSVIGGGGTALAAAPAASVAVPENAAACLKQVADILSRQKITFEAGSAEIDPQADKVVADLAAALKPCPGLPAEIAGHTDSQGSERGNKTLSQQRAEAVMSALKAAGVDVSAMSAMGYGEERPLADNDSAEGRETNRRIEFTLIGALPGADAVGPVQTPSENTLRPKPRPVDNG